MKRTLKEEKVITRLEDEVKITLIEDIDDLCIELGIDMKIYIVKVERKEFDLLDSSKCFKTKTNADKYFERTLFRIKNS